MIILSKNPRIVDQYKYKYFVDGSIDNKILTLELFEDKKVILRKKLKIKNMEQLFDLCDCLVQGIQAIHSEAFDRSLDVMAELTNEKTKRIEDFSINSSKDLNQEIDSKIEEVIFHHE